MKWKVLSPEKPLQLAWFLSKFNGLATANILPINFVWCNYRSTAENDCITSAFQGFVMSHPGYPPAGGYPPAAPGKSVT